MLKNLKIAVRTSILMVIVLLVGFVSLWRTVDNNTSSIVKSCITNQMTDAVKSRSEIIDNYVKTAEETLVTFGLAQEVVDCLLEANVEDSEEYAEVCARAQKYTEEFAAAKGIFEGLYIASYDTQILTHINVGAVGSYNKAEGDARKNFQESVLGKKELTNIGILKSPSSGEMVIAMYSPVYYGGKCIGFVGAGVYAKNLMDSLLSLNVEGLPNSEYAFLNINNGTYLYNKDPELLCTETTDIGYQEIIQNLLSDTTIDVGVHTYKDETGDSKIVIYRNFPDRGWMFALKDSEKNVYGTLEGMKRITGLICLFVGLGIIAILLVILTILGRQLSLISRSIDNLGKMNLTVDESLLKYDNRKDEIGIIAKAIISTCNNLDMYISEVDKQLSYMAKGDFSQRMTMEFIGKFKNLEESMRRIQNALRNSFKEIFTVTSELAIGSNVVAENATVLAETSVNASQLVLDIDSHVNDLSDKVSDSAKSAASSKDEMDKTTELVNNSKGKMEELSDAMNRISESASAIGNISRDMEDIAKQTNILALNALVEATRAGESGKGFGVVANEIRFLALQSNEAANKATVQINNVLSCIREGIAIGEETSSYLENVVLQTRTIDEAITTIADATQIQNESLIEVRNRLHDMNKTIESNAAMAEQSSAASTELDGQITVLRDSVGKYKI